MSTSRLHGPTGNLIRQHRASHVDSHDEVPIGVGDILRRRLALDAGNTGQHIEAAEVFDCGSENFLHRGALGDVAMVIVDRSRAGRGCLGRHPLTKIVEQVQGRDARPFACVGADGGSADTAPPPVTTILLPPSFMICSSRMAESGEPAWVGPNRCCCRRALAGIRRCYGPNSPRGCASRPDGAGRLAASGPERAPTDGGGARSRPPSSKGPGGTPPGGGRHAHWPGGPIRVQPR